MKKQFLIAMAAAVLAATGCTKVLDINPQQSIDAETALQNTEDVNGAVVGGYAILGGGALYGTNLLMFPDLLSANVDQGVGNNTLARYVTWSGTFQGQRQVWSKTMTRDNGEASRTWIAAYRAINTANTILENLGVVTDAGKKVQFEGEALFMRGAMHFELVRLYAKPWGATAGNTHLGVVVQTKAVKTEEQAFEKKPRNTVAEVYQAVIADLTSAASKLPSNNGIRANRFAALAMLSRVYLAQGNYAAALDAANQVIASNRFALQASVAAAFSNKNTSESIWEIQQNDQNNAGQTNDGMATFFASLPGIGRGDVRISTGFRSSYPDGDLRRSEWYYIGTGARPGNTYCGKWKSFTQNLPVMRIAEMFLTRAECNLRLNSSVGATPAEDMARIRNTVRTGTVAPAAPTLADVLQERVYELAFEGNRIHDIRRNRGSVGQFAWDADRLVFPIPQREVDATQGVIVQNPGY